MIGIGLWLGTLGGRLAAIAMAGLVLVGIRAWDVSHQQSKGVEKERARVETTGRKIDAKAQEVRRQVERAPPAEVDNALRRYCRDC